MAAGKATSAIYLELAQLANARNSYDDTIAALRERAALDPSKWHHIAMVCLDYALRNQERAPSERLRYIRDGLAAEARILADSPDSPYALANELALLQMQAIAITDAAERSRLAPQIAALRSRVQAIWRTSPSPLMSQPPFGGYPEPFAQTAARLRPKRVGRGVPQPIRVRDTHYTYTEDGLARSENVQGVVILEIIIDTAGSVANARVVRSIPQLDGAALATISEWRFRPTVLNGQPISVLMTVPLTYVPR